MAPLYLQWKDMAKTSCLSGIVDKTENDQAFVFEEKVTGYSDHCIY
jgi:hypothetical protein